MRDLKDILLESRNNIEFNVPFELFEQFMSDAIIDGNYDDSEYWAPMEDLIKKFYGNNSWKLFYSFCESYLYVIDDISIRQFYNNIKQISLNRFNRVIGAGSEGVVLNIDEDKVIKVCYGRGFGRVESKFFEYCFKNKSKVFPVVYKLGKNWCVMEKVTTHTKKCNDYINTIQDKTSKFKFLSDIGKGNEPNFDEFTNLQKEVYNWCITIKNEMDKFNKGGYPGDLSINNIGERDNGEIIFFDI